MRSGHAGHQKIQQSAGLLGRPLAKKMPIRPDTTSSACTSERRLPYRDDLVIVSKVGAQHVTDGQIPLAAAQKPAELRAAVEDDLRQLGLESVPVVNLRRLDLGPGRAWPPRATKPSTSMINWPR